MKKMIDYLQENHFDVIIDVRSEEEYRQGHVSGSYLLPLENIAACPFSKNLKIALYCRSGRRSELAKEVLEKQGYHKLTNIGGILDESVPLVKEP